MPAAGNARPPRVRAARVTRHPYIALEPRTE